MKKIVEKPHLFFFVLAFVLLITSFFVKNNSIDISIYDIYFAIRFTHICQFSFAFFVLIGINYFSLQWVNKTPKKILTLLHVILQLIALFLLFTKDSWNWVGNNDLEKFNLEKDNSNLVIIASVLIFILATLVHLINFFSSLLLKRD